MGHKALQLLSPQQASFKKALSLGVKIALGTDAGGLVHRHNTRELWLMVEAGMTPLQALIAGTSMGADCMGVGEDTGRIAIGRFADLLLVDTDPIASSQALEDRSHLRFIMKGG